MNEIVTKRFNIINLPNNLNQNIRKLIGPISNLYNVRTVHKLNFRIFLQDKHYKCRIVNSHFQKNIFNYDGYLKSFLRVYSDGLFISVLLLINIFKIFIFLKIFLNIK